MDEQHAEGLESTPSATSTPSRWRDIVSLVCLTLVGLTLLDAAIETSLGRADAAVRLTVALLVLAFFALLGISWKRTQWATKALASVLFFLVLAGGTAWLPGGLDNGQTGNRLQH